MSLLDKINNRKRNITKSANIINLKKDENSKISQDDSNSDKSEKSSEKSDSENDSNDDSKDNSNKSSAKEIHDSFDESQDSQNEDEEYNKLKDELDKANNFIDYFLVIGVEPEIYKKDWLFEMIWMN